MKDKQREYIYIYIKVVVFSGYSGFLHQKDWPPRYNWNIDIESGAKHHETKLSAFLIPQRNTFSLVRYMDGTGCHSP